MKSLILGATAGVGRALAESLARIGDDLVLVATDPQDLSALAAHIWCVYGRQVETVATDASSPQRCLDDIVEALEGRESPDRLLFPIGVSSLEDKGYLGARETNRLLNTNLAVIVAVTAHFLPGLMTQGSGSIIGFGSVAAVRGRSSNVVYAAAKRGLESYFQSLRQITAATNIEVSFYRLGYVDSQQSFGQTLRFPKAAPEAVSREVVRNLAHGGGFRSFPQYWAGIAWAVSLLPWALFKRIRF